MKPTLTLALALTAGLLAGSGTAGSKPLSYALPEDTTTLRPGPGPGLAAAQNNCGACHSADYVAMQPPKKGREFWTAEVVKMIKVYGAPIPEQEVGPIAEYLASVY